MSWDSYYKCNKSLFKIFYKSVEVQKKIFTRALLKNKHIITTKQSNFGTPWSLSGQCFTDAPSPSRL